MPSAGDIVVPTTDAWDAYSPTWTVTGSPSLGTGGTLTGRYKQLGKTVHLSIYGLFGSASTNPGTGGWSFSLPLTASSTSNQVRLGAAYLRDASVGSSGHFVGVCAIQPLLSTTALNAFVPTGGAANSQVGFATPFAWTISDHFSFTITYEAA